MIAFFSELSGINKSKMDKLEEGTTKLEEEYKYIHKSIEKLLSREAEVQDSTLALEEYGKTMGEKFQYLPYLNVLHH